MNKEMRELLEKINAKKAEANDFLAKAKETKDAAEKKDFKAKSTNAYQEMKELEEDYELEKVSFEANKQVITNVIPEGSIKDKYEKEFINGLRNKFKNAMSEGSAADGGYTVPQDIRTAIITLRESKDALSRFVTVEPVSTLSGSRVFKTRAQQTGFAEVAENGTITAKETPQFSPMTYNVKKYAGFFKVTNELLADSDQAIRQTLINWIGDESRVTRNKLILANLTLKAKTAIANIDEIKDIVNVILDPAFENTTMIITNQSGYNWLDKLKDGDGNYLMQPSIVEGTKKALFGLYPVAKVSNKDLPNDTTSGIKAPMIIGDLKEAIVLFDRQSLSVVASDVAGDAYLTDVTLFRAIEREEVKTRDAEAFVYGQITIS